MRIFVEVLTAPLWLRLAASKPREITYLDATPAALALSRLGAAAGIATAPMRFRMFDVRDEQGLSISYRVLYRDLNEAQDDLLAEPAFRDWIERHGDGRLDSFLAKAIATTTEAYHNRFWRSLYFIQVCAWLLRRDGGGPSTLYLQDCPWLPTLLRYAQRFDLRAEAGSGPSLRGRLRDRLRESVGQRGAGFWLRLARVHGLAAALRFKPAPRADGPVRWSSEHWGQLNLDKPELQSDQFYWHDSPLRAKPGLVIFRTFTDPLTRERLDRLRAAGLDAIATSPAAAAEPSLPIFQPTARPKGAALPPSGPDPLVPLLARETVRYRELRAFWRELFERTRSRLHVTWFKNDVMHIAAADAIRDTGGVLALYQRSYESLPTWELTCDADIHYGYTHTNAFYLAGDSRVRYHIATGFLGDHRFTALKAPALALRENLMKAGAKKIVAYFDENSLEDERWHWGHQSARTQYAFLLDKVLREPWLGLIVKPKVAKTLRRRLGPVAEALAMAEATGRCFVFEDGAALHSAHTPAAAALAADLALHAHLGAGTAAIEAALAGTPTVLLDLEGWAVSPLYALGVGRCVFKDLDSFWAAAREHLQRPGGVPGFGEWGECLDGLDPFRDGHAGERMGQHLAWLYEGLADGLGRERAMAQAAERYAGRWGARMVEELSGRSGARREAVHS